MTLLATWPIVIMRGSGDIKEKTFGREAFNEEREGEDVAHKNTKEQGRDSCVSHIETQPSPSLDQHDDERGVGYLGNDDL